ncbi:MAG: MerR family transcriptional regulator [bacterium]|nr:MerR family transcriptional regulator [bacterium]
MAEMTIGQVAQKAGVRPSALRYYEKVGLLPKPRRVGGQRRYGPDSLEWLAGIHIAQEAGFTVAEIKRLFFGFPRSAKPSERWRELAREKLPEVEELIQRATLMKQVLQEGIRCGCTSLQECSLFKSKRPESLGGRRSPD